MNVFVTGGAGYIGSICTEQLLNAGHQVTVYDNLTEGHRSAVDERAHFILGRPEEENNILNAVEQSEAEAILHFAASALVGESMANPGKYFHNNVGSKRTSFPMCCECRSAKPHNARFTALIIRPLMALASGITFTLWTWPRPIFWHWRLEKRAFIIWATAMVTRCAR